MAKPHLTLQILDSFTRIRSATPSSEVSDVQIMAEVFQAITGLEPTGGVMMSLLAEVDDILNYYAAEADKNPPTSGGEKSNLFKRLTEFLGKQDHEAMLLMLSGFDYHKKVEWYCTLPALEAIKAIQLYTAFTLQSFIAGFEANVYAAGGKIELKNTEARKLQDMPVHELAPDNPIASLMSKMKFD